MKTCQNPEFEAFSQLVERVMAVPRRLIKEREEAHRRKSAQSPRRRGPKPKGTGHAGAARTGPPAPAGQDQLSGE